MAVDPEPAGQQGGQPTTLNWLLWPANYARHSSQFGGGVVVAPPRYDRCVPPFKVVSDFEPAGDQPKAIEQLSAGIQRGDRFQTLLGITGSGKSATMAWTIEKVQRPTLV